MDNHNLWKGGVWEQERPSYPLPPPVVIPQAVPLPVSQVPDPVKPLSRRAKVAFSAVVSLIVVLMIVSVVQGARSFQGDTSNASVFGGMFGGIFDFRSSGLPSEFTSRDLDDPDVPPTIRSAPLGTGVTLEFTSPLKKALSSQEVYSKNIQSIVYITADSTRHSSSATGVIMSSDGYIITNAHVIEDSSSATVTLWDNQKYSALLVGYNFAQDLAVLKISAYNLQPAEFADSNLSLVGDPCYAIGNPLGSEYRSTFTDGMISALDRVVYVSSSPMVLIQTNTALNTGNSGGALFNEYGQVIGITTLKLMSEEDTIEGMGFAIPSLRVKQVVDRLIEGSEILPSTIGISVYNTTAPVLGVKVDFVERDSDAYAQGMRDGDIILMANNHVIQTTTDLDLVKGYLFPEDSIDYVVFRNGLEIPISAQLGVKE